MYYPIYSADSPEPIEKEWTKKEIYQHLLAMSHETVQALKGQKENYIKHLAILDEFISRNDDLHGRYIDYLNELKADPSWMDYKQEIEVALEEFGADDESMKWFMENFKGEN